MIGSSLVTHAGCGTLGSYRRRRRVTASAIRRSTMPTALTMFVTTANAPATLLVSAQMTPMIVPTTRRTTIAANP